MICSRPILLIASLVSARDLSSKESKFDILKDSCSFWTRFSKTEGPRTRSHAVRENDQPYADYYLMYHLQDFASSHISRGIFRRFLCFYEYCLDIFFFFN